MTLLTVSDPSEKNIGQGHLRKVNIEIYSHTAAAGKRHKNKTGSFDNLDLVLRSSGVLPRRNLSTTMTLLDLREGTFTAQIPLNAFNASADVTVKVIDSSLELYVNDDVMTYDVTRRRSPASNVWPKRFPSSNFPETHKTNKRYNDTIPRPPNLQFAHLYSFHFTY